MIDISHVHPMLVHFPIALLIVGLFSDILGLITRRDFFTSAGFYLLILGTLGTIAAVITGLIAGGGFAETDPLKSAVETHEDAAMLTLWLAVITTVSRVILVGLKKYKGALKVLVLILFTVTVLSIARTGYYGGELVYKHGIGVEMSSAGN